MQDEDIALKAFQVKESLKKAKKTQLQLQGESRAIIRKGKNSDGHFDSVVGASKVEIMRLQEEEILIRQDIEELIQNVQELNTELKEVKEESKCMIKHKKDDNKYHMQQLDYLEERFCNMINSLLKELSEHKATTNDSEQKTINSLLRDQIMSKIPPSSRAVAGT